MAWGIDKQIEPISGHGSDVKTVTITLGTANFKFAVVDTCDSTGAVKTVFAKAENVYCNITYRNDGTTKDAPIIVITDVDAAKELTRLGGVVTDPTKSNSMLKVLLGAMPAHDWHLRFDMTP